MLLSALVRDSFAGFLDSRLQISKDLIIAILIQQILGEINHFKKNLLHPINRSLNGGCLSRSASGKASGSAKIQIREAGNSTGIKYVLQRGWTSHRKAIIKLEKIIA